jgi:dihydroneopterin aldolase
MDCDFSLIADNLGRTIDYFALSRRMLDFGRGRSWKLIESLAVDLAEMILRDYKPIRVAVEVKKFIIPEARHVSVRVTRPTGGGDPPNIEQKETKD